MCAVWLLFGHHEFMVINFRNFTSSRRLPVYGRASTIEASPAPVKDSEAYAANVRRVVEVARRTPWSLRLKRSSKVQ